MSYDIYIGEAVVDVPSADTLRDGYNELSVCVDEFKLDDAPHFPHDEMTSNGNSRHPGYSQWSNFARQAGLHAFFFDKENGLMREHPGAFMLTQDHSEVVSNALSKWRREHQAIEPGWCGCVQCCGRMGDKAAKHVDRDGVLARLIWLDFWIRWAIGSCKVPAIYNG